jgi:hypothetical protein
MSPFVRCSLSLFLSFLCCVFAWPQQAALKMDQPDAPLARTNLSPKHRSRASRRRGQVATATTQDQGSAQLQQSLAALLGNAVVSDVTLSGSARRIAGSDDETGTATYKALSNGTARFDFSYPSGPRTEVRATGSSGCAGIWSGPDGVSHSVASHNLLTGSDIFPAFALGGFNPAQNFVITLIGQETKSGRSVYHLSASQQSSQITGTVAGLMQHLTQTDIFLDAVTFLPVALDFNIHPDNDMGLDIPIQIAFSDYRSIGGAQVPFHVQKYLNNSLILDLVFQSASLNSGLPSSLFTIR